MPDPQPSLDNIQGFIVRPYTHPCARHLLLGIGNSTDGRNLLKAIAPMITSAEHWGDDKPGNLLNVSMTYNGLKALEVTPTIVDGENSWGKNGFPMEFRNSGKANPDSTGKADFVGDSAPENWWPGAATAFTSADIHLILHLRTLDEEQLEAFTVQIRSLFDGEITEYLPMAGGKPIDNYHYPEKGMVHFGFKDGISQPHINWPGAAPPSPVYDFRNFLLGYANETHQSAPGGPFPRDGSYLVFQLIYQDVAYWNRFLRTEAEKLEDLPEVEDKEGWLAAKMLGRWQSGTSLEFAPEVDDPEKAMENDFNYSDDADGMKCPFSSHVRVSNPRHQPLHENAMPVPGLIRRGAPYGPPLEGEVDDGVDRGLIGLFICSSISRQYLKMTMWINRTDFSDVFEDLKGQDPIQGNRTIPNVSTDFIIPFKGKDIVLKNLKSFVRTQGAAFCFLPGIETIRKLGDGEYN